MKKQTNNGKGSRRRPTDEKKVRANWGNIFGEPLELKPNTGDLIKHDR